MDRRVREVSLRRSRSLPRVPAKVAPPSDLQPGSIAHVIAGTVVSIETFPNRLNCENRASRFRSSLAKLDPKPLAPRTPLPQAARTRRSGTRR